MEKSEVQFQLAQEELSMTQQALQEAWQANLRAVTRCKERW